ncbi:MAG: hypothetical protein FVQ77_02440 [Cytophagales bacterium]|nr:hypothetical protein [Cytophagales bacterium]
MREPFKKKLAREILILFGVLGLILIVTLGLWCYSLIIEKMIADKNKDIQSQQNIISNLSSTYDNKFSKIKSFITLLKTKEDENRGSNYTLYLLSKEFKVYKAVKKYEDEQSINGKLPNPKDKVSYIACIREITTDDKWSKYLVDIEDFYTIEEWVRKSGLQGNGLEELFKTDDDILSAWNCLLTNKENLYYLLPMPLLEELKIENKADLVNLFQQYSFTKAELNSKTKITELKIIKQKLEEERNNFSSKVISRDDLIKIVKIISIIILLLFYPLRLLVFTFKWAIKAYKQT